MCLNNNLEYKHILAIFMTRIMDLIFRSKRHRCYLKLWRCLSGNCLYIHVKENIDISDLQTEIIFKIEFIKLFFKLLFNIKYEIFSIRQYIEYQY